MKVRRIIRIVIGSALGLVVLISAVFVYWSFDNWRLQRRIRSAFGLAKDVALTDQALREAAIRAFPDGTSEAAVRQKLRHAFGEKSLGAESHGDVRQLPGLDLPPGNFLACRFDTEWGFLHRDFDVAYFRLNRSNLVDGVYLWCWSVYP